VTFIESANLALRFMLELSALAALGCWGWHSGGNRAAGFGLATGAPLLAALVWSQFVAPNAATALPGGVRLLLQAVIFGTAAAGLIRLGHAAFAFAFATTILLNGMLMAVLG